MSSLLQTHNHPLGPLMNAFINGIKWQKRYDPLKIISRRYCNRLHKNPYSSQIKTEIKESSTATFWGHLYKPQEKKTEDMQNTSLNTITYLLIILHKSLTKALEELWPTLHRCSLATLPFLYFQVFHPRGYCRMTVLIFAHHQG